MNKLQKSILATLAYFDLFDYPLTIDEIGKYLFVETRLIASLQDMESDLSVLINQNKINQKDDLYFLAGRERIVEIRKQRYQISLKKIKKARRVVWWLRFIPWIKAIFIGSSLGFFNAPQKSDIDLFIIVSRGGLWSARFWSVSFLKIFGLRPVSNARHENKFCLSYFVSEDNLNLWSTKIHESDIHLIYLLSHYLPLYFEDNLWQNFIKVNNWINQYLPNFSYGSEVEKFFIRPCLVWLKRIIQKSQFKWEEKLVKKIQLKIMPKILKDMANQDTRVIVNDQMLKLHSNDKRLLYYKMWQKRLHGLISDNSR